MRSWREDDKERAASEQPDVAPAVQQASRATRAGHTFALGSDDLDLDSRRDVTQVKLRAIAPVAAGDDVHIAVAGKEGVVAILAEELVLAVAAGDGVVAVVAGDEVVSVATIEAVVAVVAEERVGAGVAANLIVAFARRDYVVAAPADDVVVAAAAGDGVIAQAAVNLDRADDAIVNDDRVAAVERFDADVHDASQVEIAPDTVDLDARELGAATGGPNVQHDQVAVVGTANQQ